MGNNRNDNSISSIWAFVAGALIGAGAIFLSDKSNRAMIKDKLNQAKENANQKVNEVQEGMNEKIDDLAENAETKVRDFRQSRSKRNSGISEDDEVI